MFIVDLLWNYVPQLLPIVNPDHQRANNTEIEVYFGCLKVGVQEPHCDHRRRSAGKGARQGNRFKGHARLSQAFLHLSYWSNSAFMDVCCLISKLRSAVKTKAKSVNDQGGKSYTTGAAHILLQLQGACIF